MSAVLTISQLNKIGERLRKNQETDADLRALDDFRLSFEPAYRQVFNHLHQKGLKVGGRAGKSTLSIRAKLIRERTRLSRMQDIAGCRVVVDNVAEQDRVTSELKQTFLKHEILDRRTRPSHGYRAVHLVAYLSGLPVEIQIRTVLQHAWAEVSEKISDVLDADIKYGGGPTEVRATLDKLSNHIKSEEDQEESLRILRESDSDGNLKTKILEMENTLRARKLLLYDICQEFNITLERLKV